MSFHFKLGINLFPISHILYFPPTTFLNNHKCHYVDFHLVLKIQVSTKSFLNKPVPDVPGHEKTDLKFEMNLTIETVDREPTVVSEPFKRELARNIQLDI